MLVLTRNDVAAVLDGADTAVLDAVGDAYRAHAAGRTVVPHSVFLRFPGRERDRIIGLPAYLGGDGHDEVAGMKWIASFPGNVDRGVPRASAVVVLNRLDTGQPDVVLEGSVISARRTGASAALAARELARQPAANVATGASLIGCGVINFEVLRYLRHTLADLREVTVYDLDRRRADDFAARCARQWPELAVECARSVDETMARHPVISVATTAARPYLDLDACAAGSVVLHVSLRDLTVDSVLSADNVVDDADHVCREQTSLHMAEQAVGHRGFIRASIGDILLGNGPVGPDPARVTVFSPFGLGVLDLAVARLVRSVAQRHGHGVHVPNFLG